MSIYYTVRVFTDVVRYNHSCLVRNVSNKIQPWGMCHATGPAHRFLWQEEAEEALRLYLSYGPAKIYKRGRVYHVTEEGVGPLLTPGEVSHGSSEAPREHSEKVFPSHSPTLPDLEQGEALLEATIQDPGDEGALAKLQIWSSENAELLLFTIRGCKRLKDRLSEIDELVGRRVEVIQEDLNRLQQMVEKKTEQNPVDFPLNEMA